MSMNKRRNWQVFIILIVVTGIIFNMAKIKNLSPKFKIPLAEKELELQIGQIPMASQSGGLNMYSNKFKRGYGDAVFGSDENGIWLGAAEFTGSPFNVGMDGALAAKSATFTDENNTTIIDAAGLVSTTSFTKSDVDEDALNQSITTAEPNWTNITNASHTFSLERSAVVLIQAKVTLWVSGGVTVDPLVGINIDGNPPSGALRTHRIWFRDPTVTVTASMHRIETLGSGSHTIILQGTVNRASGSPILNIYNYYFSYIILGK